MWWKTMLLAMAYAAIALGLLYGVLWFSRDFGTTEPTMTLIAALGGALMASFGPVITAMLTNLGQERDRGERIKDEASRMAMELTKMGYDLLQRALADGQSQQVLRPVKVYREFYKAIVELRTKETWPKAPEEQGLLNVIELRGQLTPHR
jgi:hypothetical protein